MCHSVAFECANDAKKNDPNVYFHMESGENRPEVVCACILFGQAVVLYVVLSAASSSSAATVISAKHR